MTRKKKILCVGFVLLVLVVAFLWGTDLGRETQFILGGALINLGYRMQDHLESYDFAHHEEITPEHVWDEMLKQNRMASGVRQMFPRSTHHPLVALVACMDARIDTNELTGDTRRYYYVIRTAGSELSEREEEMLELAVENGVKLILLTTHSDCVAEKVAASPEKRKRFPALAKAVDERDQRIHELLARPAISTRIKEGKLAVKLVNIDTMTERMLPSQAED